MEKKEEKEEFRRVFMKLCLQVITIKFADNGKEGRKGRIQF